MRFKEYIQESKQVGTIHHFTTHDSLHHMLNQENALHLHSRNGENISFTRNPHLPMFNHNFKSCGVRISVDGDKMSEHHKIRPVAGLADDSKGVLDTKNTNRISRKDGEAEETVIKHPLNILPYIKHIHIIKHKDLDDAYEKHLKPRLNELGIDYTYSKSFARTSMKEDYKFLPWDMWYELS